MESKRFALRLVGISFGIALVIILIAVPIVLTRRKESTELIEIIRTTTTTTPIRMYCVYMYFTD